MRLPAAFVERMRGWLGPEWAELSDALGGRPLRALRLHRVGTRGGDPAAALAIQAPALPLPADLRAQLGDPVPWCEPAHFVAADVPAGRHVYHEAGAHYLQEPSAMAAATALDPQPGERVLDLCAAPGGKAGALGWALRGTGLLVANDVRPERARVLGRNLERLGVPALVVAGAAQALADRWPGRFDAVLADAPCSGEGLFRRTPQACGQWSEAAVAGCARRQREILAAAVRLARPGGRVLYATCTFNPVENEQVVDWALRELPVAAAELPLWPGWEPGRPDWGGGTADVARARRLWPHRGRGEGHFLAMFTVARGGAPRAADGRAPAGAGGDALPQGWAAWLRGLLDQAPPAWQRPLRRGRYLFAAAAAELPLDGLHLVRPGLCLAQAGAAGLLRPHHELAMAVCAQRVRRPRELDLGAARAYLAGEPLPAGREGGTVWLHTRGLPLGWGHDAGPRTNNLYPKGLRRTDLVTAW